MEDPNKEERVRQLRIRFLEMQLSVVRLVVERMQAAVPQLPPQPIWKLSPNGALKRVVLWSAAVGATGELVVRLLISLMFWTPPTLWGIRSVVFSACFGAVGAYIKMRWDVCAWIWVEVVGDLRKETGQEAPPIWFRKIYSFSADFLIISLSWFAKNKFDKTHAHSLMSYLSCVLGDLICARIMLFFAKRWGLSEERAQEFYMGTNVANVVTAVLVHGVARVGGNAWYETLKGFDAIRAISVLLIGLAISIAAMEGFRRVQRVRNGAGR